MATEHYPWGDATQAAHVAEKLRQIESQNSNLPALKTSKFLEEARDYVSPTLPDVHASLENVYQVPDTVNPDSEHRWDAKMPGKLMKSQWRSSATVLDHVEPLHHHQHQQQQQQSTTDGSLQKLDIEKTLAEEAKIAVYKRKGIELKTIPVAAPAKDHDFEVREAAERQEREVQTYLADLRAEMKAEEAEKIKATYLRMTSFPPPNAVYFKKRRHTISMRADPFSSVWEAVDNPPKHLAQLQFSRIVQKGDSKTKPTVWEYKDSHRRKYLVKPVPFSVEAAKSNEPRHIAELRSSHYTYNVMEKPAKGTRLWEGVLEF